MKSIKHETIILWVVCFVLISVYIGFDSIVNYIAPQKDTNPVADKPSITMQITGRYLLGARYMTERLNSSVKTTNQSQPLSLKKAELVYNNSDQLCYGILLGELVNRKTAWTYFRNLKLPDKADSLRNDLLFLQTIYSAPSYTSKDAESKLLQKKLGWFAEIAITSHLPAADPRKKAAQAPAIRMLFIVIIATIVGILLALASILLFFKTLHAMANKTFTFKYQHMAAADTLLPITDGESNVNHENPDNNTHRLVYFRAFLFFMAGLLLLSLLSIFISRIVVICGYIVLPVIIYLLFFRSTNWQNFRHATGLFKGEGFIKEIASGMVGYITGIPVLILGLIVSSILAKYTKTQPMHPIVHYIKDAHMLYLIIIFIFASLIAPIMEEILFRGLFYHYLREKLSLVLSALVSGLVFAAIHPQGLVALPVLAAIAFNLAIIREWRGSLIAPIVAHSFNNSMAVGLLIVFML